MHATKSWRCWAAAVLCLACAGAARGADANGAGGSAMVELNFPENLSLKVLVDYVGKRQNVSFIYDEGTIRDRKVTIKAAQKVPVDSLMAVLESSLTMNGLMLTTTDVPGLVRIEPAKPLTAVSTGLGGTVAEANGLAVAVTRVLDLKYVSAQQAEQAVKPFLATQTANVMALPGHRVLIVTDYARNIPRILDVLAVVDRPREKSIIRFVPVEHVDAAQMEQKVTQLLAKQLGGDSAAGGGLSLLADTRTNQLIVIAPREEDLLQVTQLVHSLDTAEELQTRNYAFQSVQAERMDRLVKELIGDVAAKHAYRSVVDKETNLLIVSASPETHARIEDLRKLLDRPLPDSESPIRFYKLENARAVSVLETIRGIEGDAGLGGATMDGASATSRPSSEGLIIQGPTPEQVNSGGVPRLGAGARSAGVGRAVTLSNARVMADEGTNAIIVVAKPEAQTVYEKLIKRLDVRRPQVLIEATIVLVNTTNDFSLGVEILRNNGFDGGSGHTLNFSSFGLSKVDVSTPSLTITPGVGFNGTLVSSDIANVVVRALESDSRVRVVSRPSVLVDDNAKAELASQNEAPYSSVNASSTVATTSFAGYTTAGVNIAVRPQVSEGDHLKLEYDITLSSFGTDASAALPPSRQSNHLTSEGTTIPDGYTIVVGGLNREEINKTTDRVPWLGRLPALEYLFSNRSDTKHKETLFVFLRAVTLRDDKFESLKFLSREAARRAEIVGEFPSSEPVAIR